MEGQRTKNALLFVIALCLVLIVLRLYSSGDFVREAQAQTLGTGTHEADLYACQPYTGGAPGCDWVPVLVNSRRALVTAQ